MPSDLNPRRRGDRIRRKILESLFPLAGTVVLLIAVILAIVLSLKGGR